MWLALLKNPLTKMIANKAIDHFKHKAEKSKLLEKQNYKLVKKQMFKELNHKIKVGKMKY